MSGLGRMLNIPARRILRWFNDWLEDQRLHFVGIQLRFDPVESKSRVG
jgi:hypothetical protein